MMLHATCNIYVLCHEYSSVAMGRQYRKGTERGQNRLDLLVLVSLCCFLLLCVRACDILCLTKEVRE